MSYTVMAAPSNNVNENVDCIWVNKVLLLWQKYHCFRNTKPEHDISNAAGDVDLSCIVYIQR